MLRALINVMISAWRPDYCYNAHYKYNLLGSLCWTCRRHQQALPVPTKNQVTTTTLSSWWAGRQLTASSCAFEVPPRNINLYLKSQPPPDPGRGALDRTKQNQRRAHPSFRGLRPITTTSHHPPWTATVNPTPTEPPFAEGITKLKLSILVNRSFNCNWSSHPLIGETRAMH